MPMRGLAFDLAQAAVYLYHNSPERKPFMDPRLEVASKVTFETYFVAPQGNERGSAGMVRGGGTDGRAVDLARSCQGVRGRSDASGRSPLARACTSTRWLRFSWKAAGRISKRRIRRSTSRPSIFSARRGDLSARGFDKAFGELQWAGLRGPLAAEEGRDVDAAAPDPFPGRRPGREALAISSGEAPGVAGLRLCALVS